MHNSKFKSVFLMLLSMSLYQGVVQAFEDKIPELNTEVILTIKPHICIAPRGVSSCISRIDIIWESNQVTDVCLHVSLSSDVLQCWDQRKTGVYQHKVIIIQNLDYWVTSKNHQHMWAKSSVKFASLKPHRKQKRRRNHLPWSIQSL